MRKIKKVNNNLLKKNKDLNEKNNPDFLLKLSNEKIEQLKREYFKTKKEIEIFLEIIKSKTAEN